VFGRGDGRGRGGYGGLEGRRAVEGVFENAFGLNVSWVFIVSSSHDCVFPIEKKNVE